MKNCARIVLVVLCLGLLGAVAWLFVPMAGPDYHWPQRQLFFSESAFRETEYEGLWLYAPETDVVEAAVYDMPGETLALEYLCRFRTNTLGLVDTNWNSGDLHAEYLVLGDSLTQGSGGCPWLVRSALPENFPVLLNGGLQGVGLQSHLLLERWLTERVNIGQVILILTGPGLSRSLPGRFWDDANRNDHFLWYVAPTVTAAQLLSLAQERRRIRGDENVEASSAAYQAACLARLLAWAGLKAVPQDQQAAIERNLEAFRSLREKYPAMKVIVVPEKHETGFARCEDDRTRLLKTFLARENVSYSVCALERPDFLAHDGHPNAAGYAKIGRCLRAVL